MIHVTATPLTEQQVIKLRRWLSTEEAELFREVLLSNLADLQAKAGQELIESDDEQTHQDESATVAAHDALPFVHTLKIMQEFQMRDGRLILVKLSLNPPVAVPETT
jgi:hypothetical protein